jgi:hypothetical protein
MNFDWPLSTRTLSGSGYDSSENLAPVVLDLRLERQQTTQLGHSGAVSENFTPTEFGVSR